MLSEIFQKPKPILGRVQLLALPGSPHWDGNWDSLITRAEQEATALATGGVDGLILENAHDTPFSRERMDVAGAIAMALLAKRLKQFTHLPIGVSVLRNDPETALAIALNAQVDFLRLSLLQGALVTESGVLNSRLNELLHYKNRLKAELPPLLVDISPQHLCAGSQPLASGSLQAESAALLALAQTLTLTHLPSVSLAVSSRFARPETLAMLRQQLTLPLWLEHQDPQTQPDAWFEQADGLILDAGIRKTSSLQADLPPTIDMPLVEEMINRLRGVQSVQEMDPDLFLQR